MEEQERQINNSISRGGFIGFIITIVITFIMEFVLGGDNPAIEIPPYVKFIIYVMFMAVVVIFSVQKPEMSRFMKVVRDSLEDGRITPEEAMAMMRQGWFVFQGFWADISHIANKKKKEIEEEKIEEEKIEETELN